MGMGGFLNSSGNGLRGTDGGDAYGGGTGDSGTADERGFADCHWHGFGEYDADSGDIVSDTAPRLLVFPA